MEYESSYEVGRKKFTPDVKRGKWSKPTDFIFACCGLSLKLDVFVVIQWVYSEMGLFGIIPYYFYMAIFMVPLLVIHSFMGQFSSSGFISAFRLSPFFKGMGYVSLFLSIASLLFYAVFAIVPLIFIVNSLRPTMPWSCEGLQHMETEITFCNVTHLKSEGVSELPTSMFRHRYGNTDIVIPSVIFFKEQFSNFGSVIDGKSNISWTIVGFAIMLWAIIGYIFRNFSHAPKFGKLLRYMILTVFGLALICLVRFLFLPGAWKGFTNYVKPDGNSLAYGSMSMSVMALQAFGSGWGSVMSLSSFNSFNTNIMKYSWIIAFGQSLAYILFGMVTFMLEHYFETMYFNNVDLRLKSFWILYLSSASALATLEWSNLWTILYYLMLLISSLIVMITQIFTILTSLFDEFEILRAHKQRVTFILIGCLTLCTLLFCTSRGYLYFTTVSLDAMFTYGVMHLLLILAVLWIYGRERFQRDIEFMLKQPFASWKIFILRFIAPLFIFSAMFLGTVLSFLQYFHHFYSVGYLSILLLQLPLLFIPGYGIYITYRNTGRFCSRLRRSCRPTDWYPQEMEDRQQYEENLGNSDLTHQMYEITEEDI